MGKPIVHLPRRDAARLLWIYARTKVVQQMKVVIPLVLVLLAFQLVVLRIASADALGTAGGIGLVIVGLALFLEGIRLSIMPLGEEVGLHLPVQAGLLLSLVFGLVVGMGATLAEPAIAVLRLLGSSLRAWEAPLLFVLLNRYSTLLILAIGLGVGVAVVLSLLRAYFVWSLKPLIVTLVPAVLGLTFWAYLTPNLRLITGLAWDAGGVTTGPVTVPLVVSLGVGVSRALKREESATSGLGVVTLASLLPIAAVLILGIILAPRIPGPMDKTEFFSAHRRSETMQLFDSEADLTRYARANGVTALTAAAIADEATDDPNDTEDGVSTTTSANSPVEPDMDSEPASAPGRTELIQQSIVAARSVIPLSLILALVLVVFLRRRVSHWDEVAIGVLLALTGMVLLNFGIEQGLTRLGNGVGRRLPATFQTVAVEDEQRTIRNFDREMVRSAVADDGSVDRFFYLKEGHEYRAVPFDDAQFNRAESRYRYVPHLGPVFSTAAVGLAVVLLFSWATGYMATTAEPALAILGGVVEDVTAGALHRSWLVRIVGSGVGVGMAVGVLKIAFQIPMLWLLAPAYGLLLILTLVSTEEFVNIAWDSAGVTTGPVTVPLIIAFGLGLGSELGTVESFGIISLASLFPIIAVLLAGIVVGRRERASMRGIS
ncbi:MAG: DUF1538 family protein [Alkalispirochaeta sp.]